VLREYVMGEAMHHLGIPTTRALAAVTTGAQVRREGLLPGAVLARVAQSHIRVGTFQFFAIRDDVPKLQQLVRYTLARHYPEHVDAANPALALLREAITAQASLIAQWMLVGFIHGVMNTDNMTLSGETIDYGPCAFMDVYHPGTVFSSIDRQGRYAYGNQPGIGQWNLARLAEALLPLLFAEPAALDPWLLRWRERMAQDGGDASGRAVAMRRVNPWLIPRNHRVEEALEAASESGDLSPFEELLAALAEPFDERSDRERYAEPAPREVTARYQTFCGT
jgi:uncharacterized protein YdiU (UPF0061 family)